MCVWFTYCIVIGVNRENNQYVGSIRIDCGLLEEEANSDLSEEEDDGAQRRSSRIQARSGKSSRRKEVEPESGFLVVHVLSRAVVLFFRVV